MYLNLHIYSTPSEIRKEKLTDLSKNMKIVDLQKKIEDEFGIEVSLQRLVYKGKILSGTNGETLLHYKANFNETIQVHKRVVLGELEATDSNIPKVEPEKEKKVEEQLEDAESLIYRVGDLVDVKDTDEKSETIGAFFEAKIRRITKNPVPEEESDGLNYHVVYDKYPNDDTDYKFSDSKLRPRARTLVNLSDLQVDQEVLVNFNLSAPEKVGEWYEGKVTEINLRKKILICTLYLGVDRTPFPDGKICHLQQIFALEKPVPVADRTTNIQKAMDQVVERQHTVECDNCDDNPKKKCKECGCNKCGKKNNPETLVICDECGNNFHTKCVGLDSVPEEDEYFCPDCKREDTTIKPGSKALMERLKNAPSQKNGQTRDFGRGFACAGRTKINDQVEVDRKGHIPGTEVGMSWLYRVQVSEVGIHRPVVAGIHASEKSGAMSIVVNGGYEDDDDHGEFFTYTGAGGRELKEGNRRTNVQSKDQEFTGANKGLAMNCAAPLNKDGAEAKDWRAGVPVRVVRGSKPHLVKRPKGHKGPVAPNPSAQYSPKEGFRYDGLYKIVKYYPIVGQAGFIVYRYEMRRDDDSVAPWTPEGQKLKEERGWDCIYPEGKKRKAEEDGEKENSGPEAKKLKFSLRPELKKLIKKDEHHKKEWKELLAQEFTNMEEFKEKVEQLFSCSVCLMIVTVPVKLDCKHNMCKGCLARFNREGEEGAKVCPVCRGDFKGNEKENEELRAILNYLFTGYEV